MEAPRSDTATFSIDDLLEHMVALGASDLHVTTGSHPVIRVAGKLTRLEDFPRLTPDDTQRILYRILSTEQQKHLEINRQIDVSHSIPGLARFRVNIYFQRESLGAAFRMMPASFSVARRWSSSPPSQTWRRQVSWERTVPPQSMKSFRTRPTSVMWKASGTEPPSGRWIFSVPRPLRW